MERRRKGIELRNFERSGIDGAGSAGSWARESEGLELGLAESDAGGGPRLQNDELIVEKRRLEIEG